MLSPPTQLKAPSPLVRRALAFLWFGLLAVGIVGQAGGLWRGHSYVTETLPAFAMVGLSVEQDVEDDEEYIYDAVSPASAETRRLGIPAAGWIYQVDGVDTTEVETEKLAELLAGEIGTSVLVDIEAPDGTEKRYRLTRSQANRDEAYSEDDQWLTLGSVILFALLAIPYAGAAALLWRRQPDRPVSIMLSFAFLAFAGWGFGPMLFWEWTGRLEVWAAITMLWICLLTAALPAFPDGRFQPRWTRWLLVVGPVVAILIPMPFVGEEVLLSLLTLLFLTMLVMLTFPARRFRRMPPGLERQQMKWAALGLLGGPALWVSAAVLGVVAATLPLGDFAEGLAGIVFLLVYLGFVLIPVGIIISLLRYRLNDADAAIGKSAGYAAITLMVGAVWAITTTWANGFIASNLGVVNTAVAPGVSAVIAAAVFAPLNKKIMGSMERKFQRALVRLRSLPGRLAKWQQGDDPVHVAERALDAIVDGVQARKAALIGIIADGRRVLATYNVEADALCAELDARDGEADGGSFALSVPLVDGDEPVGLLLLGERSDGAPYSKDERAAIALVREPLTDAIRITARRAEKDAAFMTILSAMEERVTRIEGPHRRLG